MGRHSAEKINYEINQGRMTPSQFNVEREENKKFNTPYSRGGRLGNLFKRTRQGRESREIMSAQTETKNRRFGKAVLATAAALAVAIGGETVTANAASVNQVALDKSHNQVYYSPGFGETHNTGDTVTIGATNVAGHTVRSLDVPQGFIDNFPAPLGPIGIEKSSEIGSNAIVADVKNRLPAGSEVTLSGWSYGNFHTNKAAEKLAADGYKVHLTDAGSPHTPGSGWSSVMPEIPGMGVEYGDSATGPNITKEVYLKSGDVFGNMPASLSKDVYIPNPLSTLAMIRSTGSTHYGMGYNADGYNNFKTDKTYVKDGVTYHVDETENGLVLYAEDAGIKLNDQQKQFLRDIAPQGTPGVKPAEVTPRDITDVMTDPQSAIGAAVKDGTRAIENIFKPIQAPAVVPAPAPAPAPAPTPAPANVYTGPAPTYENPVVNQAVDQAQTWANQAPVNQATKNNINTAVVGAASSFDQLQKQVEKDFSEATDHLNKLGEQFGLPPIR